LKIAEVVTEPLSHDTQRFMTVQWYYCLKGKANKSTFDTLKKKIGQFATRTNKHYYVGKACESNPSKKRWTARYKPDGYTKITVLCETKTQADAYWLEI